MCVTPVDRTVEIATEVLSLGLPCVIEKPLGVSAAQARALADAAERTGTPHMVSMNRRHWPYLVRALEWIGDRPVRLVRAEMARDRRTEDAFIWSTAIHAVDTMVHLGGPIAGHQTHVVAGGELTATWYSISLEFAGDCRGQLQIVPTCGRLQETYELLGEGWSVRVTMRDENAFGLQCRQGRKCVIDESFHEPARPWLGDGSYGEVCAFVGALRGERPFSPTVEEVLPATELCFELARLGE